LKRWLTVTTIIISIVIVVGAYVIYESLRPEVEEASFIEARERMVESHLKGRDIVDLKLLEVMGRIPRHKFVDKSLWDVAYADQPLPIGEGQTISQPYVVALMTQSLELKGSERVLEIGTGSGYQAAILAEICEEVYTIEIKEELAKGAEETLRTLGYDKVQVKWADGYFGWEEHAPFDAVIVTCAVDHVPPHIVEQLGDGGRIIIPLGSPKYYQTLALIRKQGDELTVTYITTVRFVPMTGEALSGEG